MKLATIKYRRGKTTRSPYAKREKNKRRFSYSDWAQGGPVRPTFPHWLVLELRANILAVFPKLAQTPPHQRKPAWLWLREPPKEADAQAS